MDKLLFVIHADLICIVFPIIRIVILKGCFCPGKKYYWKEVLKNQQNEFKMLTLHRGCGYSM